MSIYDEIAVERARAHEKHKNHGGGSIEARSWDTPRRYYILAEEVGEVAKAFNDYEHGVIPTEDGLRAELRKELIQVAAMAASWVDAIDRAALPETP